MKEPKDTLILVVDDEPELQQAIAFGFKRKGYKLLFAENGEEALKLVESNPIDIVISDVRMPKVDGVTLLSTIRNKNGEVPAVFLITAYSEFSVEEAYQRGANAVFPKPFDRHALLKAVVDAMTPNRNIWQDEKIRVDCEGRAELKFSGTGDTVQVPSITVGRSGVFVPMTQGFPREGIAVELRIFPSQDSVPVCVEAVGSVKWIRKESLEGKVAGIGIEFTGMTRDSESRIVRFINQSKTNSFSTVER